MSYYRAHQSLNDKVDAKSLDDLAITNPAAKERQLLEIKNSLSVALKIIGNITGDKVDFIAGRLQDKGYGFETCHKAFNDLPDHFDKIPSYREIEQFTRRYKKQTELIENIYQENPDQEKYQKIKKLFLSKASEKQLEQYVKWWLKDCVGIESNTVKNFMPIAAFEMPALFDWWDNFCQWDLEKIKRVYAMKDLHLSKEKEKQAEFNGRYIIKPFNEINKNKIEA
jgi:hypothetical protein